MTLVRLLCTACLATLTFPALVSAQQALAELNTAPSIRSQVTLTPDHELQPGVPPGELKGTFEFQSQIYAGTSRRYWVFVPAQYDASNAASLLVFQDGHRASNPNGSIRIQTVMANLIAQKAMPVTIGLFITPGNMSPTYPDDLGWSNPNHRWQEYDVVNNTYARFLIEEMIPLLERNYHLTDDPNQRAIGGTSSGAIAAFTAAWFRPDYFRKVYSSIGSFVSIGYHPAEPGMQTGGQDYPALIRREPIRPLRIFMQDGINDLDNEWGNWFLANQQMAAAFRYVNKHADEQALPGPRYALKTVWTDGEHNDSHPGALLPEGLRWLWQE
ncbi:esterase family protein [Aestuariibacter sp. GS-14]|uniref:alpha/beta hydrolase n=1 Tax=Aestuariibacter sp. GS-14 TaxID=2590670 RepID=UPI001125DD95|nr:alpha/beta hydrolase-fold protein [Aestuariibacter sp. GS-14]TPV57408.1 esterase family protein [Aestuariibacter sp. GS-14]